MTFQVNSMRDLDKICYNKNVIYIYENLGSDFFKKCQYGNILLLLLKRSII